MEASSTAGEWLEAALAELCGRVEGLDLDADLIAGLVSFCELAPPQDAADYLLNIVGFDAGQNVIQQYLQMRGFVDSSVSAQDVHTSKLQPYMKPPADEGVIVASKKESKTPREATVSTPHYVKSQPEPAEPSNISKGSPNVHKKKKAGKVISLADAAKGSVVFQQGKPCSCQARRHKLVSNCLSCGKIVCEQEGEGPCSFCGALVLKEGSRYADLDDQVVPLSDTEVQAEAYAKRLVEYDRNSAARTKVIDDQSDYYEMEGNSSLSPQERDLLKQKQKEIEEAIELRKKNVIVTLDLVGRKVIMNKDEALDSESNSSILRPPKEREANRIKPNPSVKVQPVFVTEPVRRPIRKNQNKRTANGLCLEISGRVQHDGKELHRFLTDDQREASSDGGFWPEGDDPECPFDYN